MRPYFQSPGEFELLPVTIYAVRIRLQPSFRPFPMLVVYGIPESQPVRAVLWACAIHGLPYELRKTRPGSSKPGGQWSNQLFRYYSTVHGWMYLN